jgi:hypothetical protein
VYKHMADVGFKKTSITVDKKTHRVWLIDRTIDPKDTKAVSAAYKSITSTTQSKF